MSRPLFLLSNDDGIDAPGLAALHAVFASLGDVVVVAPERNQSAVSHGLTLTQVLRPKQVGPARFAIDGTPADCVYVALNPTAGMLPRRPDLVISGINDGPNLGVDVHYSGTVAAAREGALRGISAMAVSAGSSKALGTAAEVAARLATALLDEQARGRVDHPVLLNVNVPGGTVRGLRATQLGSRTYADEVVVRTDPRNRSYLWIGSAALELPAGDARDSDTRAFHSGWASVTPLLTNVSASAERPLVRRLIGRRPAP